MAAKKSTVKSVIDALGTLGDKALSLFSALMAAALIAYGGYALYDSLYIEGKAFSSSWDILQFRPEIIEDDGVPLSTLAQQNQDYRAWLTLYETGIDYPIMQGKDDVYYASHDILKKSSLTGSLYLAAGNKADFSDNYNVVYGHHMKADALFGCLDKFADRTYFNDHREGVLVTKDAIYDLTVFAVVKTDAYNLEYYQVGKRDLAKLVKTIRSNKVQLDATVAGKAKKVLAMSTCETAETNGRLIVFANMQKRDLNQAVPANPQEVTPAPAGPQAPAGDNPGTARVVPATPGSPDTPGTARVVPATPGPSETTGAPQAAEGTAQDNGAQLEAGQPGGAGAAEGEGAAGQANGQQAAQSEEEQTVPIQEVIDDEDNPLANAFDPSGSSYDSTWALANLVCLLATLFLLLPIGSVRDKYRRAKRMRDANAHGASYESDAFECDLLVGVVLEGVLSAAALVTFLVTQNLAGRMALIDMFTPVMIMLLIAVLAVDLKFVRYHKDERGGSGPHGANPAAAGA